MAFSKVALVISFLLTSITFGQLDEICQTSCKILAQGKNHGGWGSGTVVKETDEHFYILTAGHVTEHRNKIFTFLSFEGYYSNAIPTVKEFDIYTDDDLEDFAILRISKKDIDYTHPKVAKINSDIKLEVNEKIYTWGHPEGNHGTGFVGKLKKIDGGVIRFYPKVFSGRSGSGLFNKHGFIGVVVRARLRRDRVSLSEAISIVNVMEMLEKHDPELHKIIINE